MNPANADQATFVALTIAGSDPSGGAGLQADLKTMQQLGVYGMSVVTLLTVQNTQSVRAVEVMPVQLVIDQLLACISDIPPQAAKTGALGSPEIIAAVGHGARQFCFPLVVDPVMISKHHVALMEPEGIEAMVRDLLPHAYLVTPNLPEASKLVGRAVNTLDQMKQAAREIANLGPKNVFLKGGHLHDEATDVLYADGEILEMRAERIKTKHTHGTGCTTSAAITAGLAMGLPLVKAVEQAKHFVTEAIRTNPGLGHGLGPVNFFVKPC
jgi:hydroxymethylpyrimidine/phosphomethylpyrimidine kinase